MSTSNDFLAYFIGEFQAILEATEIPDMHGASWDRKAAWLLYQATKGNTEMARGRKKATNEVAEKLLEVMNFLDVGYKTSGNTQARTTIFWQGWAFSFDGVIAAGTPTMETFQFDGAVDTKLFKEALSRVGKDMELVIRDDGAFFSSTDFTAIVPKVPFSELQPVTPDPAQAPFQQGVNFINALDLAGRAIRDSAENLRDACIMTNNDTVIATNGKVMIQAWHGNYMPTGLLFPKAFANALKSAGRDPVSFGFSAGTFTAYYADGSFIRTQTYPVESYPQDQIMGALDRLLTAPVVAPPVKGLIEAVEKVVPFADDEGIVWFTGGSVKVGPSDAEGWTAEVDVKDLPEGVGVHGASVLAYKGEIKTLWLGDPDNADGTPRAVLYGDTFRAAVLGAILAAPAPVEAPPPPLAPSAPDWGNGQISATPPPPQGWGTPAAAPTGGAPTSEAPAAPSASVMTAPATGWGQQAQTNAEASPSENPSPSAPVEGSASGTGQWPMQAPAAAPAAPQTGTDGAATSPSEQAPSWHMAPAQAATPPEGQEPNLTGAPGWDHVRAGTTGAPAPGGWGSPANWPTPTEE